MSIREIPRFAISMPYGSCDFLLPCPTKQSLIDGLIHCKKHDWINVEILDLKTDEYTTLAILEEVSNDEIRQKVEEIANLFDSGGYAVFESDREIDCRQCIPDKF